MIGSFHRWKSFPHVGLQPLITNKKEQSLLISLVPLIYQGELEKLHYL